MLGWLSFSHPTNQPKHSLSATRKWPHLIP